MTTSALRVRQLAQSLGKNVTPARRVSTIVASALPRPMRTPAAAAGIVLSGSAGAAHADEGATVIDSTVQGIVGVVQAAGDAVKAGLGAAEQGVDAAKSAYQTIAPIVQTTTEAMGPAVKSAVDAASPVVQAGVRAAGEAASTVTPSLERVLSDTGVDSRAVVGAGEQAVAAAKPLLESLVTFVTTSPPEIVAETAVGLVAAYYLLPPVFKATVGLLRGYAGDVSPAAALDALSTQGNAVLVDVRSARDKEQQGLPDLSNAGKLVELEYATIEDRKIRGQLRDIGALEIKITAMQIAALKRLSTASPIYLLDRSGGLAKAVAKELAGRGFGKVYVINGGFSGWQRDRLGTKLASSVSRVEVLLPGSVRGGGSARQLPAGGSARSVQVLPPSPPRRALPSGSSGSSR